MIAEILTPCSFAKDDNGRLTIVEAFTRLSVSNAPGILPELVVAIRIRSAADEDGHHNFCLSVLDLEGKLLAEPIRTPFETRTQDGEEYAWANAVARINGIQICERNDLILNLQIDDESIANTTIYVTVSTSSRTSAAHT